VLTFFRNRKAQATQRIPKPHIRNHCNICGTYAFTSSCFLTPRSSSLAAGLALARLRFVDSVPAVFPASGSMVSSGYKWNKYQFIGLYIKCVPSSAERASQQRPRLVLLLQDLLVSFLAACPVWELSIKHWFSELHHLRLVARARNNITDTRKKSCEVPHQIVTLF
jgi:hypothetical protein